MVIKGETNKMQTDNDLFNQLCLSIFWAFLHPSSGELTALYFTAYGFQHWLLLVVVLESGW
jgi:hypothetical protein